MTIKVQTIVFCDGQKNYCHRSESKSKSTCEFLMDLRNPIKFTSMFTCRRSYLFYESAFRRARNTHNHFDECRERNNKCALFREKIKTDILYLTLIF